MHPQQAKETGRALRQQAITRKQREGPLSQADLRALHGEARAHASAAQRNSTPPRKQPRTTTATAPRPLSVLLPTQPSGATKQERGGGAHSVRRMMPTQQARTAGPLVPVTLQVPEGVELDRVFLEVPPSCTVGVLKTYVRRKLPGKVCLCLCVCCGGVVVTTGNVRWWCVFANKQYTACVSHFNNIVCTFICYAFLSQDHEPQLSLPASAQHEVLPDSATVASLVRRVLIDNVQADLVVQVVL